MPVIGFLGAGSFEGSTERLRAFRLGLKDNGYIDGENVAMEYRWTENQPDQLAELATDLVRRQVSVIVTSGGPSSATAAKSATVTTPIVFIVNEDPVKLGLVTSLARPSGNLTGVNIFLSELAAKRLELLRELLPAAARVIVLVNPSNAVITESTLRDVDVAARGLGLQIQVVQASSAPEINSAFAAFSRERPDALFVSGDPFFLDRRVQIANLASHYSIPVASGVRGIAEAGGLMSYGASLSDAYRQVGVYTGRILKGAKTADLPVLQSSKFELIINAETARMLGIAIPPAMLARADEVIE
jgi:putative ABC transport system substrate-binding protein